MDSAKHALEYIMLGASAVQVGTAVMTQGHSAIGTIVDELENWLDAHGLASVEQVRGKALANMKSFDEMKIEPAVSTVQSVPCTENCDKCLTSCIYGAISRSETSVNVDEQTCTGCGLCTFICPAKKLKLAW